MGIRRKINIQLCLAVIIFILVLFFSDIIFLNRKIDGNIKTTCDLQADDTANKLENAIAALKSTVDKISKDSEIIKVLQENEGHNDLDDNEISLIEMRINTFQDLLKTWTFTDSITVSSYKGEYLFSRGVLFKDFKIQERPWYKTRRLNPANNGFVGDMHQDFITGRYTISVISSVYSEDSKLLGMVVLDVFIDDLLKSINDDFYLGDLKSYVRLKDGRYYSPDRLLGSIENTYDKYYTVTKEIKSLNNFQIILRFDKSSIIYKKTFRDFKVFQFEFYCSVGFVLAALLITMVNKMINPITTCVEKFKSLLYKRDDEKLKLENKSELQQLEYISDILSKTLDEKVNKLIYYDELTKLPNRKSLQRICNQLIKDSKEFAIIFIDLNKFKSINDLFGHMVGDEFLKEFSVRMKDVVKDKGIVTRYSGDEFIIIYTEYKGIEELKKTYEECILPSFREPIALQKNKLFAEFSAGVAIYPDNGSTLDELVKKSDFMMYHNKKYNATKSLIIV